jgi:hypothetical protein
MRFKMDSANVRRILYSGDFNFMEQAWQSDGTVIITLIRNNSGNQQTIRCRIKDLYKDSEDILDIVEANVKIPDHILGRLRGVIDNASTE